MCGICGELRFDGQGADPRAVGAMRESLAPRGPDGSRELYSGPAGFGHARLAILDLSEAAAQPMQDCATGAMLAFNGTIYNHPQLRRELSGLGHRFASTGDTEVLLRAWIQWGPDCLAKLEGMFAFAVYEPRSGKLFLARDRFGIKPLYWTCDEKRLRFASTPQALMAAPGPAPELDPEGLALAFTFHSAVPAPRTVMKGIRKMPAGHCMQLSAAGPANPAPRPWHSLESLPAETLSGQEWTEKARHALARAIDSHMGISDVPVGVLLSGGLDSSLIVAMLAQAGHSNLATFTVGFDDDENEGGREFYYSDLVAKRFGTVHRKRHVSNDELFEQLPSAIRQMSEPMFSQDVCAFYLLSELVRSEGYKAVLSGQGADEAFGGYFWYPLMQAERASPAERFAKHYFDRSRSELASLLAPEFMPAGDLPFEIASAALEGPGEFLDRVQRFDCQCLMPEDPVKRVDNMAMAWGVEARVPFLDRAVAETALSMPWQLRLSLGGKGPLKAIARGLVPDEAIDRPKGYFPAPALKFLRGKFLELCRDTLNSQACAERGVFRRSAVAAMLDAPNSRFTPIQGNPLWHAALMELWICEHLRQKP